jgi:hypothetical protein
MTLPLTMQIRNALKRSPMTAEELMQACPSAKDEKKLKNYLHQLSHSGRIYRVGRREVVKPRKSNRTRTHEIRQLDSIWAIGDWPGSVVVAENLPSWIAPNREPSVKGVARMIDNGMHRSDGEPNEP